MKIHALSTIDANDALHICNQFNNQKRVLITFERAPFFEGLRLSSVLSEGKFFLSQSKSFSFIFFILSFIITVSLH